MTTETHYLKCAAIAVCTLVLTNCSTTERIVTPSTSSNYRPASGSAVMVQVTRGETVAAVAKRYRVSEEDVYAMNNLNPTQRIATGDRLYIPAYGTAPRRTAAEYGKVPPKFGASIPARSNTSGNAANAVPRPRPAPRVATNQVGQQNNAVQRSWWNPVSANSATTTTGAFVWPVNGRVLSNFGQAPGGGRNDGINIAAPQGTPFRAAADGTVTYVGNELKNYGNLLLIRHDNGFVTAYAHADRIAVARGERVRAGEVVGFAGDSGDVTQPQLHFEIRQGVKPVNPTAYQQGRTTTASLPTSRS
jgi:murein DD-endopeptidase MepM/ murein hydrolase activator NlpD